MSEDFNTSYDKLEFRQIVLRHIKNILDISLRSNQDGQKLFLYYNSIEALADVLIPFYDEQMNTEIDEFESELKEININNSTKKQELCEHDYSCSYLGIYRTKKKRLYRNLFRKLNLLLNRNDYLKTSVYGEDKDEVVEDD